MRLPDAPWRHWPGMDDLLVALDAEGGKLRYVGGAVRDSLLGIEVIDVDCATVFPAEQVIERLDGVGIKTVPTGLKHGTVTAIIDGHPVEVTTLRRDIETDGRHARIEYTEDWQEDAARRDFTINALSADPLSGEIFDYFGGGADLEARRVRFIGMPAERIAEDHLRILRFFRFHARFGAGLPNPAGLAAAAEHANSLMALSRERIADELLKILALPDPSATIALMIERGVLTPVLPEIEDTVTLERVIAREGKFDRAPSPVRRLAALLPAEPETARAVSVRLKLSNANRKRIASAAARMPGDTATPRALAYRHGTESAVDRLLLCKTNDIVVGRALATLADNPPPEFPLRGGDLIAMGVEAGPEVSRLLHEIEQAWIAEDFPGEDRAQELAKQLVRTAP